MEENQASPHKPWLSSYDEWVPATMDYPEIRLDQLLADSAAKHPEQQAIVFGARVGSRVLDAALSYQQLDQAVNQLATSLQQLGVGRGDRVAIIMPNCPQFVIAFYGILRAGGIAVPCNFLYSASELEHQLADAGAEIAIVLSPYYPRVHSIRSGAGLRHVIVTNIKEYFPPLLRLLFTLTKEKKGGHRTVLASPDDFWFESLLAAPRTVPKPIQTNPQDTACLLYTGGTTGVPKGAQLTHHNLVSNAVAGLAWSGAQQANEVTIGALPLFHSYGMTSVMNMSVAGALTMVLIPDPRDILH
ncbi:MAG: AMP-binding protein, partial [Anaerolineae bacterium]|nr:AMP-binding protein [Anaerolineae bacterium]